MKVIVCDKHIKEYFSSFLKELKGVQIDEAKVEIYEDIDCGGSERKKIINIHSFATNPKGMGYGRKAMEEICRLADKYGISLSLYPTDKSEFYKKFGFKYILKGYPPSDMFRLQAEHITNRIVFIE